MSSSMSLVQIFVGDRVYQMTDKGTMLVFRAARTWEELGRSELGEPCISSPIVLDGRLYIRGAKHLFCIAGDAP